MVVNVEVVIGPITSLVAARVAGTRSPPIWM